MDQPNTVQENTANESGAAPQLTVPQAISNLQQTEDQGDRYYAAWWIGRFQVREPEAVEALLVALKDEQNRDTDGGFPLRRNAARALGKVGDEAVIPALLDCLDCDDYYVREAAAQSLQSLSAKAAIQPLSTLLAGGVEAAVPVPGKPHLTQPYNAILEALGDLGDKLGDETSSHELTSIIEPFLQHETPQVRNGAARAMYQLTDKGQYAEILVETLACDDLQLRRSALLDLGEVGYLPAAEAVANTLAENSIKLISLKGLLEKHLADKIDAKNTQHSTGLVSHEARKVMSLMDSLL